MAELPVVHASGGPYERGVAIGQALADGHCRSVDFVHRYVERHGLAVTDLEPLLAPYLTAARSAVPRLVTHLEGVAAGSGLSFVDVFAVNAFEELYGVLEMSVPPPIPIERCTDVIVRSDDGLILGHNEQWYAGDDGGVAVLVEHPDSPDEVATVAPVSVGTLPLVGMNAAGGALGLMSLSSRDERVGVPRALLGRDGIEATDRADAVQRATRAGRAGGYSYAYAFAGGDAFVLEVTATSHALLDDHVHTNHALAPQLADLVEESSAGSRSRYDRACALVDDDQVRSAQDVMHLLSDHGAAGQDICVHPDLGQGEEGSAIQFAMVCDVETGVMWLAPGQPCSTPFVELRLADLF